MNNHTYILFVVLIACLLFGCGVKKPAVVTEQAIAENSESEKAIAENSVAEPAAVTIVQDSIGQVTQDTLPDFLKEFANDSTIHINWAYGIPFIIDDSVPMLLPSIEKTPKGYVSNRDFTKRFPEIDYSLNKDISFYELALIDSILWLNKCVNDIYQFLQIESKEVQIGHRFSILSRLCRISENEEIITIDVAQAPYWSCMCSAIACEQDIRYCFDMSGNLIGKYFTKEPYYQEGGKRYLRKADYLENGVINNFNEAKAYKLLWMRIYNINDICCIHN